MGNKRINICQNMKKGFLLKRKRKKSKKKEKGQRKNRYSQ